MVAGHRRLIQAVVLRNPSLWQDSLAWLSSKTDRLSMPVQVHQWYPLDS